MVHPPPAPHGPPPGGPFPRPSARGPRPLVFLLGAVAAVALAVLVAVAVSNAAAGDDPAARAASGPVDLSEPLTFKLVAEESEQPCAPGALTTGPNAPCYTFGADGLTVRRLEKIKAVAPDAASGDIGWTVRLTLVPADASGFAALTGKAAQAYADQRPGAAMGMLVGGLLVSEPAQVTEPITGAEVQISGPSDRFTRAYTENLVHRMIGR